MSPPRHGRAGTRGFTLLELMFAFAILSIVMVSLVQIQTGAMARGAKALDLRDLRVMADTVFRRLVYENWKWEDGARGYADDWYADFAGLPPGPARERWKIYRLEFHKKKGLVAGNDPSGALESLVSDGSTTSTTRGSSSSGTGSSATGSSGGGSSGSTEQTPTGEPAYLYELDVFLRESEEPELTLRSIIPVPESEREEGTAK